MTETSFEDPQALIANAAVAAWEAHARAARLPLMEWTFENTDDVWTMVGRPSHEGASAITAAVEWTNALDQFGDGWPEPNKKHGVWTWTKHVGVLVELAVVADRDALEQWRGEQAEDPDWREGKRA
ncbi:hypothetical protein [Ornithinicoccus hortensis]|uniref:hypothetical protein n=1 Tax=Ornithinicoccus hortensis TaxID=82346 RepID=UPI00114EE714|nr:hypothetical protein [Ornithinicoccus hortensis]